jgi:hypothetical protein
LSIAGVFRSVDVRKLRTMYCFTSKRVFRDMGLAFPDSGWSGPGLSITGSNLSSFRCYRENRFDVGKLRQGSHICTGQVYLGVECSTMY